MKVVATACMLILVTAVTLPAKVHPTMIVVPFTTTFLQVGDGVGKDVGTESKPLVGEVVGRREVGEVVG